MEHTCRRSFTCFSTLTTVSFSTCQDNIHKWAIVWVCFCSPGSWKHLQLWGRWVCGHCQDRMPSSLGDFSWASAPSLELLLRTKERKSRISQFSLDPAGVQSDTRWSGKLPKDGRKNIKTWTQENSESEAKSTQMKLLESNSRFLSLTSSFLQPLFVWVELTYSHHVEAAWHSLPW